MIATYHMLNHVKEGFFVKQPENQPKIIPNTHHKMSVPAATVIAPKPPVPMSETAPPAAKGLTFKATFSTPETSPFDEIEWSERTAEITDDSGAIMVRQENVQVPASWSELSTKIAVSKYFYGDITQGTDPCNGGRENSIRQMIHRVTRTITDW
ncbi:MAG: hypothetical protein N2F24_02530, partial [Deltaproteobacteria bacterium]